MSWDKGGGVHKSWVGAQCLFWRTLEQSLCFFHSVKIDWIFFRIQCVFTSGKSEGGGILGLLPPAHDHDGALCSSVTARPLPSA